MKSLYVLISGRVQGVGYRYSTQKQAERYQIKGWVRNREDGKVEACFQGEGLALQKMLEWCQQGPPFAQVTALEVHEEENPVFFSGFQIRT